MKKSNKIDPKLINQFSPQAKRRERKISVFFLIVCEGEKTEPNYFKAFPEYRKDVEHKIECKDSNKKTSALQVVERAIELRNNSRKKPDSVWVVFDKDDNTAADFHKAIQQAESEGIKVAWSNQSFELWYVLHFQYRNTPMLREEYQNAIENGIKSKSGKPFKYKKNDPEMFRLLQNNGSQEEAMKNAQKLVENFEGNSFANHNPCTKVYLLVKELIGECKDLNLQIDKKLQKGE